MSEAPKTKSLVRLRTVAAKTLAQVLHSNLTLDEAMLSEFTRNSAVTPPEFDRAWIYETCSGVLRYKGRLDFIIDTYALKKKPTGPLRRFLYTAVYQMLAQETPAALIVSETVQAVRESEGEPPSKFANALLRKVADSIDEWKNWSITEKSPRDEQAAWCSLPKWLFEKLVKQRGFEFTVAFSKASLERPSLWYRNIKTQKAEALKEGQHADRNDGFVQDISNQLLVDQVSKIFSEAFSAPAKNVSPSILDLCSAPGGKSLALASHGWTVVATDKDPNRLLKVTENRNRLGFKAEQLEVGNYTEIWRSGKRWNAVWIDVPCMSIGIIRRHPEIKWNRSDKDIPGLVEKQKELVRWAVHHLAKDGLLIYSTCSLLNEENNLKDPELKTVLNELFHGEWFPQNEPHGDGIVATVYRFTGDVKEN